MSKPKDSTSPQPLNYSGAYPCPICRHGEVSAMPLMEAFACNFCNHIFTANLDQQLLKMADGQLPLTWHWNGSKWKGSQREGRELDWIYGVAGVTFVLFPTAIVGCAAYLFPPLPGSYLSWLPNAWVLLTFSAHLAVLIWLVLEYYQFSLFLYLRTLGRRFLVRE